MPKVYIGLGSNMGDKSGNILKALELLDQHKKIRFVKRSSLYETEPVGYEDQDWFVNAVAELETELSPQELLDALMKVEQNMGRKREIKWGPRNIDLDILLYDQQCLDEPDLIIPHPRMHERRFVLVPLVEIAPRLVDPRDGREYAGILERLDEGKKVSKSIRNES